MNFTYLAVLVKVHCLENRVLSVLSFRWRFLQGLSVWDKYFDQNFRCFTQLANPPFPRCWGRDGIHFRFGEKPFVLWPVLFHLWVKGSPDFSSWPNPVLHGRWAAAAKGFKSSSVRPPWRWEQRRTTPGSLAKSIPSMFARGVVVGRWATKV